MSIPLFFRPATIVEHLDARRGRPVRDWLARAGAPCRASGAWVERRVVVVRGAALVERQPGEWGNVRIGVPRGLDPRAEARLVVGALAYGIGDLVCRESLRGAPWARPRPPRGRPRSGAALSGRERQRAFRARQRRGA